LDGRRRIAFPLEGLLHKFVIVGEGLLREFVVVGEGVLREFVVVGEWLLEYFLIVASFGSSERTSTVTPAGSCASSSLALADSRL